MLVEELFKIVVKFISNMINLLFAQIFQIFSTIILVGIWTYYIRKQKFHNYKPKPIDKILMIGSILLLLISTIVLFKSLD